MAEEIKLTPQGFKHTEAYALMWYECEKCRKEEQLWNARDGVTPFIIHCPMCNGEMKHIRWSNDLCLPEYVPPNGMRIFIDTPQEAYAIFIKMKINRFWHHDTYPMSANYGSQKDAFDALMKEYKKEEPFIITWELG